MTTHPPNHTPWSAGYWFTHRHGHDGRWMHEFGPTK
jgi:hypothetical protein